MTAAGQELQDTPMSDRQRKYREIYRSRVVGWYNGWLHVAIIYAIGLAMMTIARPRSPPSARSISGTR